MKWRSGCERAAQGGDGDGGGGGGEEENKEEGGGAGGRGGKKETSRIWETGSGEETEEPGTETDAEEGFSSRGGGASGPRTVNDNQGKKKLQILLAIACCSRTNSTQVFFAVSLCLFLTTSTLLVSDYKQKDSLALRQAVGKLALNWQIWIVKILTKFDRTNDSQMS